MNNRGITIISLVVTVILLIIVAGIGINLSLGENGIFNKTKYAKEKYLNAQKDEENKLNDLYSQMLVATGDDAKITISAKELKEIIQEEIKNSVQQPTRVKDNIFIKNSIKNNSNYSTVTSMSNAFTKTEDENSKIKEYLSYSQEEGYTVLRSGWYFINLQMEISTSNTSVDGSVSFILNGKNISGVRVWAYSSSERNDNSFSIYLNKDDKIYFSSNGTNTATYRSGQAICYPMF